MTLSSDPSSFPPIHPSTLTTTSLELPNFQPIVTNQLLALTVFLPIIMSYIKFPALGHSLSLNPSDQDDFSSCFLYNSIDNLN